MLVYSRDILSDISITILY